MCSIGVEVVCAIGLRRRAAGGGGERLARPEGAGFATRRGPALPRPRLALLESGTSKVSAAFRLVIGELPSQGLRRPSSDRRRCRYGTPLGVSHIILKSGDVQENA